MKRIGLFLLSFVLICTSASAQDLVENFLKKHEKEAEFSVVNITSKMFELMSYMTEEQDQSVLQKLTGLKVITVEQNVDKYYKDALQMLRKSDHEELMSVVDNGDNVQMYTKEKKKGVISSLIMLVQDEFEFTLIGITGEIDLKQLSTISKQLNIDLPNIEGVSDISIN